MATAPTFTPAEIAAGQQFFATNPTPEQIYGKASEIGLSPDQVAGLYQQSVGGDFTGLLGGVNDYLSGTSQSLSGGYKSGLYAPELTQFTPKEIIDVAQSRTPEGGDVRKTLLDYGTEQGYSFDQIDRILGLAPGSTQTYSGSLSTTTKTPTKQEIIDVAQSRTPEGGDVRKTLLDYGTEQGYSFDQIDRILGLAPGSTQTYSGSLSTTTKTPTKPVTVGSIVNQIAGTSGTPTTINAPQSMGAYDTSNYFERYFPVSVTGGRANQTTGLNNVSGQSSLADILANIQGQYTPQQFTRSGGSYGAGRFLPADMVPGMVNQAGGTGFTPSEISKATEYFGQVTDPQQIFDRANQIGLSGPQLADLFSKSTGANYGDVLQSINDWSAATGQTLKGGYTPGSAPWFEPASFEQYSQSLIDKSLDQAVAETMGSAGGAGGSGGGADGTPSAWSQMTESERQSWVDANPGKYVAGLTAAVALLPGGAYLASKQDPYMGMSLAEYAAGKAGNIAMGGLLEPGQGAPVVVSSGNTVSDQAAMDRALQGASDFYG